MNIMKTINRSPVKTEIRYDGDVVIDWHCHGINQHGNRIYWKEKTFTSAIVDDLYDSELFENKVTYVTKKYILRPNVFMEVIR